MLRNTFLSLALTVSVFVGSAFTAPAGEDASGVEARALPGVPEAVAGLISLNHYQCWCVQFLGPVPAGVACNTQTNFIDVYQTTTVTGAKTIEDGTVTVTSTSVSTVIAVGAIATTIHETTVTETTRTTTPSFTAPPRTLAKRDVALPSFLSGLARDVVSSACSLLLPSLAQVPPVTTISVTRILTATATSYTTTVTTPRQTTTTTTATTTITVPAAPLFTTTTTTTVTSTKVFTACPAPTRFNDVPTVGTDNGQGSFQYHEDAESAEDCCLACYDPSKTVNCNMWRWGGSCVTLSSLSPNNDKSDMCPNGRGDGYFRQSNAGQAQGGPGPCGGKVECRGLQRGSACTP